jgi:hypothetical protein
MALRINGAAIAIANITETAIILKILKTLFLKSRINRIVKAPRIQPCKMLTIYEIVFLVDSFIKTSNISILT